MARIYDIYINRRFIREEGTCIDIDTFVYIYICICIYIYVQILRCFDCSGVPVECRAAEGGCEGEQEPFGEVQPLWGCATERSPGADAVLAEEVAVLALGLAQRALLVAVVQVVAVAAWPDAALLVQRVFHVGSVFEIVFVGSAAPRWQIHF